MEKLAEMAKKKTLFDEREEVEHMSKVIREVRVLSSLKITIFTIFEINFLLCQVYLTDGYS